MALYNFHRVLISCAILFDFFFCLWSVRQWNLTGEAINIVMAVGSSVVTVGLIAYLIYFNRVLMVIRDGDESGDPSESRKPVAPMSDRLAQLTKLHNADPKDPFLTYGIALEHAKAGDPRKAIAWLDKTLALDQRYSYAYYQKAKALSELGDAAAARKVLEQGIAATKLGSGRDSAKAADEMQQLLESLN